MGSVLLGLGCSGVTLLSGLRDHAPVRSGWLVSVSEHRFRRRLRPRPRADLGVAPAATTIVSGGILTVVYLWRQDYPCLILAHIATDLYGIVLAPYLARAGAN